jgi:hypothetical protein
VNPKLLIEVLRILGCTVISFSGSRPPCIAALMQNPLKVGAQLLQYFSAAEMEEVYEHKLLVRDDGWYYCCWETIPWPKGVI